jgi:hypothetical protein
MATAKLKTYHVTRWYLVNCSADIRATSLVDAATKLAQMKYTDLDQEDDPESTTDESIWSNS